MSLPTDLDADARGSGEQPAAPSRWALVVALALPCLAALALRLVGAGPILGGGGPHAPLLDEEAYRRALALLPLLGAQAPLLATLATLTLSLLAVVLATHLACMLAGPRWAVVAGLQLALLPLLIEQGRLGRVDPQLLEPALALAVVGLVVRPSGRARSAAIVLLVGAGALLLPSPLPFVVIVGAGAAHALGTGARRRALARLALLAAALIPAAILRGPTLLETLAPPPPLWSVLPLGERGLGDLLPQSVVALLTHLPLAMPLLLLLALLAPCRSRDRELGPCLLLAASSGAFMVAGALQLRHLGSGLALAAPLAALGLRELARRVDRLVARRARHGLRRAIAPALAIGALTLLWPLVDYLEGGRPELERVRPRAFAEAAAVVRRVDPGGTILVLPPSGALGLELAGRRWLAPPTHPGAWNAREREVVALLLSPLVEESHAIASRLGLRWIAVDELPSRTASELAQGIGQPLDHVAFAYHHRRAFGARLVTDSGSGRLFSSLPITALSWLQHTWESRPVHARPQLELFRRVEGARIVGRAAPGALVALRLELLSNRGRPFRYEDFQRADDAGRFSFRLPYATSRGPSADVVRHLAEQERLRHALGIGARFKPLQPLDLPRTIALGPARIRAPGCHLEVQVTDEDVTRGRVLPTEETRCLPR